MKTIVYEMGVVGRKVGSIVGTRIFVVGKGVGNLAGFSATKGEFVGLGEGLGVSLADGLAIGEFVGATKVGR